MNTIADIAIVLLGNSGPLKVKLSIIIVNFRSEKYLIGCIASIYASLKGMVPFEIIIINNDKEETLEKIKHDFPDVIIGNHGRNLGFGTSCNIGAKMAKGELLLFLNPDTEILSTNIDDLLSAFDESEVGIIGSGLVDGKGNVQEWSAGFDKNIVDLLRNNFSFPRSRQIWEQNNKTSAEWVAGTAMFIRRDLFDKLGGFDENYFMYFEDIDLCRRVRDLKKGILFFPDFRVKHYSGRSFLATSDQKKHYYDSQEYYFSKHCGSFQSVIIKAARRLLLR